MMEITFVVRDKQVKGWSDVFEESVAEISHVMKARL
jgi:hypothetical protein